jgi:long-chain acyl-CoA synthetase
MFDPLTSDNTSLAQYSSVQYSQGDEARPWIRHYEQGVPAHLALPDYPLLWLLDRTSERYPNQIAFSYYGLRLTYAQFLRDANRFAGALQRLGVKKGDRVAIALPISHNILLPFTVP